MAFIKDLLHRVAGASSSASHHGPASTPEFLAERQKWQETRTQDEVLADFTKYLQNGTPSWGPAFNEKEIETLQKTFAAHAKSEKSWDQQSLESYLLTQIPEGDETLLKSSIPALWDLTVYFAHWPFNTAFSAPTTSLTQPGLVRAVAFLSGRHYRLFKSWKNSDMEFNRKTDQPVLEYIFRALADAQPAGQQSGASSDRDVLDILNVTQPVLSENTQTLTREQLTPTATRLAPPPAPELSSLAVPAQKLVQLLDLSIAVLQQAAKFDVTSRPQSIKEGLEAAKVEIQKGDKVTFDTYSKLLDKGEWVEKNNNVDTIYDAVAVLFNTFTNPQSLKTGETVNWSSGKKEKLYLGSLRSLGLTHN
ncbi:unnamed protein product [Clonostachys solani]|uniref:Uncharacterized protein n=1 Tax=Clonostachys solani TaxID=160281 RepID=A0A9N9Z7B7_9HYPO|nr:unnamed protein product [Clonostachys solani]